MNWRIYLEEEELGTTLKLIHQKIHQFEYIIIPPDLQVKKK